MLTKVSPKVWKFTGTDKVNFYLLELDELIVIDAGDRADRQKAEFFLSKAVDLKKVSKVIFTHLHYDHIGNFDLFPKAKFYASKESIKEFNRDKAGAVLDDHLLSKFNVELHPLPEKVGPLEIIDTPGHTQGSICIWYPEEKMLFSGDTLFNHKEFGRTDLPTSMPSALNDSLVKLINYNYKILCPGHDYEF